MKWNLVRNKCICKNDNDKILYNQSMDFSILSPYEFSARRDRKIEHYRISRCQNCGLVRSDPILSQKDVAKLYAESKFLYSDESKSVAETYKHILEKNLHFFNKSKKLKLLEIGCGNGTFLEKAYEMGIKNITGVEPSLESIKKVPKKIKPLIINDIFKKKQFKPNSFDIIACFHTIDHIINPDETIDECCKILKKGGIMLTVCHNVDSFINKILGEKSPVFDIEHIFLFNKRTIEQLFEKNGFITIKTGYVINKYQLSYWLKYLPFIKHMIKILPKFILNMTIPLYAGNIYNCSQKR